MSRPSAQVTQQKRDVVSSPIRCATVSRVHPSNSSRIALCTRRSDSLSSDAAVSVEDDEHPRRSDYLKRSGRTGFVENDYFAPSNERSSQTNELTLTLRQIRTRAMYWRVEIEVIICFVLSSESTPLQSRPKGLIVVFIFWVKIRA